MYIDFETEYDSELALFVESRPSPRRRFTTHPYVQDVPIDGYSSSGYKNNSKLNGVTCQSHYYTVSSDVSYTIDVLDTSQMDAQLGLLLSILSSA